MFPIKDLLADALRALMGPRHSRQAAALDAWPEVVGMPRARHARPVGIRGNALIVVTDLPVLSYELGLRRAALVEALNRKIGEQVIDDIRIVVRPMSELQDDSTQGKVGD